jgi:hypothetical protein
MTGYAGTQARFLFTTLRNDDECPPDNRHLEAEVCDLLRGIVAKRYTNIVVRVCICCVAANNAQQ